MVQFCPKCGTKAPDDESVFCNKCGTRLPPVIPEKMDNSCPRCGAKAPDEQSVFCNKCGSPLHTISQVQVQSTRAQPIAAPPVMRKKSCPSCGAPLNENTDYCDSCGAYLRRPDPLNTGTETTRENDHPYQEHAGPDNLVTERTSNGEDLPVRKRSWKSLAGLGIIAIVAIVFLVVIGASISGIISGTNQSSNTTPVPALQTTLPTQKTTQTPAPVTTAPAIVTTAPVPTTFVKTNTSTKVPSNASATVRTNTSATVRTNATANVTTTPPPTISSQPYAIGQSATDGKAKVTVNSFTFKDKLSDPIPSYAIGKKYLIVEITYENLQNATADANLNGMLVTDGGGFPFEPASDSALENAFIGKNIPPQQKQTGNIVFIVPPEATLLQLHYDFGNQNSAKFQLT